MRQFIGYVKSFILLSEHQKYTRASILKISSLEIYLCPNGRKKSHCMLVRRAACSQLCLGVKIGEMFIPPASKGDNVHTARFNGQNQDTRYKIQKKCWETKLLILKKIYNFGIEHFI